MSFYKRRRFSPKRRSYRKRRYIPRFFKKGIKQKGGVTTHFHKRIIVSEVAITNSGWQNPGVNSVKLEDFTGYTELTNMYDIYKICAIKKKFIFNRNSAEAGASVEIPQLITVNDPNDSTGLLDEAEALLYPSFKSTRLNKPVTRYYKPFIENTVTAGSTSMKSRWLNTSGGGDIVHHGLKYCVDTIDTSTGTTLGTLRIYTTAYLAFRNPR